MKIIFKIILMIFWFAEFGMVIAGYVPSKLIIGWAFIALGLFYLGELLEESLK